MNKKVCAMLLGFTDHSSPPPSSFVPPKRGAGAGVSVGMWRGGGIPWLENKRVSTSQTFKVSNFQSVKASKFQSFSIPKFQNLKFPSSKFSKLWEHTFQKNQALRFSDSQNNPDGFRPDHSGVWPNGGRSSVFSELLSLSCCWSKFNVKFEAFLWTAWFGRQAC